VSVKRVVSIVERDDVGMRGFNDLSVSVRLEAELADGRRIVLLDDRGWNAKFSCGDGGLFWDAADIAELARVVVGPDEPSDGETADEMAAGHWAYLSERLQDHGVAVDSREFQRALHDVVLGEHLRSRLATHLERGGEEH
jgi:hypothetical protein